MSFLAYSKLIISKLPTNHAVPAGQAVKHHCFQN